MVNISTHAAAHIWTPFKAKLARQQRRTSIEQGFNLASLIESEIAAVANLITQSQIDEGAEMLAKAGTTYMVGRGGAAPLMAHLDRRLRRAGFRAETLLNLQRRDMAERLIGLRVHGTIIVFGFQAPVSLPACQLNAEC